MDGNIDVYDPIYNVFLEGVKIGDTIIDGSILEDLTPYLDFGQGDNYVEQLRNEREQTVRDALKKANLPHDDSSVAVVTDMLANEYSNGRGIGEFRLSDQVGNSATYGRSSLVLLTHSNMPHSHNYSRFGKARELITYRYKADALTPETEAIIRALEPSLTVSVSAEDGSHGILYSHADIKEAIPDGWHLPTLDDLYRLYSALGGKVIRSGAVDCGKMYSNSWSNGRAFAMCGVRIPRQLNKGDSYPSLYITTDQGRCDIVRSNENEDDEIRETGKSAPDIMRDLLGFGSLALAGPENGTIRKSTFGNVAPFVSQEVCITDLLDADGNVKTQIHWFRSARVDLVGDRLIMHTESGEECGLAIDRDVNGAINILAEALFCELKIRFNTDVARRKFTPADLVALATSLSGCGETTEETPQLCGTDAQCILTSDGRAALVDEFFNRLRNHVVNTTVNCYV